MEQIILKLQCTICKDKRCTFETTKNNIKKLNCPMNFNKRCKWIQTFNF